MRTRRLLRKVHHRAKIIPVRPLRTRLIRINTSYWTIFSSFEIILEWKLSIGLNFKYNVQCKSIASKTFSLI